MREIFTSGSVGGAPGNRCFYLEPDSLKLAGELNVTDTCYKNQDIRQLKS